MACFGGLTALVMHLAAWSYRLPPRAAAPPAAERAAKAAAPAPAAVAAPAPAHATAAAAPAAAAPAAAAPAAAAPAAAAPPGGGGLTLGEAMGTPQLYLLGLGTLSLGMVGLPFISTSRFLINDIFGPTLFAASATTGGAATVAALGVYATGFPALLSSANTGGRLAWGPIADRLGLSRTIALASGLSVPALCLGPLATSLVASDPATALHIFRASAWSAVGCFAAAPLMLAPMAAERFGAEHAAQIYTRLWLMVPLANFVGSNVMMAWRAHAKASAASELAGACDDAAFEAAFGAAKAELPALLRANAVTIEKLLDVAPVGTPDPSPHLYDEVFYALPAVGLLALACNFAAFRLPLPPPRQSGV